MATCNFCLGAQKCITCVLRKTGRINVETPTAISLAMRESRQWRPYVSGFLNFANRMSQATRVKNLGSTSQLFRAFRQSEGAVTSLHDWERFYTNQVVNEDQQSGLEAISTAGARLYAQVDRIRAELDQITPQECEDYVRDLVIDKSFIGHGIEEAVLRKIAEKTGRIFTPSTLDDERRGIDGYLDDEPVSVKPASYRADENTHDTPLPAKVFYYALSESDVTSEQLRKVAQQYDIRFQSSRSSKKQMWEAVIGSGNIFFWEE